MDDKRRIPGHGPGFPKNPGQPFASQGPEAVYRAWRPDSSLHLELRVRMRGASYQQVQLVGIGTDGLPIQLSYRGHQDCALGISMFRMIRSSEGTEWERVADARPFSARADLA